MNLRQLRLSKGITLTQLSEQTNINISNLQRIEAGAVDPRLSTTEAILHTLGYEIIVVDKK